MMDHQGGAEDNIGIPDDLRCKRSDGKQWRCTAMSMPDKTVCEKHYIQAKKRAASSAMRASLKKKRKSLGESDIYLESKSDDMDLPLSSQFGDYSGSSGKKKKEKLSKNQAKYSPEAPPGRSFSGRSSLRSTDDLERDGSEYEDSRRCYRTPPTSAVDSDRSRSQKMFEISPMTEASDGSLESSDDDTGEQPCHQCRSSNRDRVVWCLKCDGRGYCESCIATWYSDIPVEEFQRLCPACRGTCSCRVCMRGDNLIKARIREIPAKDKLQYLYCLLAAVLPIVKQIHAVQCSEVELEKRLRGNEIDLGRTKLNADEQMCWLVGAYWLSICICFSMACMRIFFSYFTKLRTCDFCRTPIIDYHRHCINCSYDLCLSCCNDIREASMCSVNEDMGSVGNESQKNDKLIVRKPSCLSDVQLNSLKKLTDWKANADGSVQCPGKAHGGCGSSVLTLKRIFKMNWVAKLVKNVEEMVSGCKIDDSGNPEEICDGLKLCQAAHREDNDNFLYHPSSETLKNDGIKDFRIHWRRGKPVIVKNIFDASAMAIWDPLAIWRGVRETAAEKMKDENIIVKAIDCRDRTEISIELEEFIQGYSSGRLQDNGQSQLLKLKDWPSPSASEEFLLYQRPDFISKLPLLEFIHSKWGLLNVAAKLPHYSLQNDVGPKIYIAYGEVEEIGDCNSTENLHLNMRDMVFLLVHICEAKLTGKEMQDDAVAQSDRGLDSDTEICVSGSGHIISTDRLDGYEADERANEPEKKDDLEIEGSSVIEEKGISCFENKPGGKPLKMQAGAHWDVFRREDIPKLMDYIFIHQMDFVKSNHALGDYVSQTLYDGSVYLNTHHKSKLKDEFGVEPWSFEQHIAEAVFIPAGCPFQVRHLQSSVQLGLDFLSPESLAEAQRISEEIRGLPNDHEAKLQILEVGKISLYAASSAIKEVQKLVLDPKLRTELGSEDPNLTSLVSRNLDNMVKHRQISCT
ncbi:E3 ubiquitin-protein ligase JMJ24 isoform X2 [Andrographis paniculata]|uniref:E3 ubiquitin-protein ligase JMJ24 isoform X2 n=1 Tax=Andrographis paniculata TaxID=175694 RepID=UPI0021E85634|nr:E3 ubiquitin-protein ligase JMJ24 isoform X2 [Andrographis paniculata]